MPASQSQQGHLTQENRLFLNAIFWILPTGADPSIRRLKNVHCRFCRWPDKGVWERLLLLLLDESDYKWLRMDASSVQIDSKPRPLVETAFLGPKQWRGLATRYAKNSPSYLAAVHIYLVG